MDTLDDLKKTDPVHNSGEWAIDTANKDYFSRDAGRAHRTTDTVQSLAWSGGECTNFAASIYFDVKLDINSLVTFVSSINGKDWQPVKTARSPSVSSGGGWNVSTFRPETSSLPAGSRFMKLQLAPSGTNWNVQVGRMELYRKGSALGNKVR